MHVRTGPIVLEVYPFLIVTEETEIKLGDGYEEYKWILPENLKSMKTMISLNRIVDSLLSRRESGGKIC